MGSVVARCVAENPEFSGEAHHVSLDASEHRREMCAAIGKLHSYFFSGREIVIISSVGSVALASLA
jgi:hypothetical protein